MTATTSVSVPTRQVPTSGTSGRRWSTPDGVRTAAESVTDVSRQLAAERHPTLDPRWYDAPLAIGTVASLALAWILAGRLVAGFGPIASFEALVAEWFLAERTPRFDGWAESASSVSRPGAVVLVAVCLALVSYASTRRRDDVLTILLPLPIGAVVFLATANMIERPRPSIPTLEEAVMVTSFPSGHVAAVTLLAGVIVVAHRRIRYPVVAGLLVLLLGAGAIAVAVSRLYLGMHHLTDVIAGGLLGLTCVGVSTWLVDRMHRRLAAAPPSDSPV